MRSYIDGLDRAEVRALEAVRGAPGEFSPKELIDHLKHTGLPEECVRPATWDLIDRKEMELNRNWTLDPGKAF